MRLPASIHARLPRAANADHRSMADVSLIAIEIHLDALDKRPPRSADQSARTPARVGSAWRSRYHRSMATPASKLLEEALACR
jgi:hypothetical protein